MIVCEVTLKKWGNSIGMVVPKDALKKESLREGQKMRVMLVPVKAPKVKDLLGKAKLKTPTEELVRQIDRELDSKFFR